MSLQQIQLATSDKVQYVQHAPYLIDQMKAADIPLITELLDYTEQCLRAQQETVVRKFLVVRLLKDGVIIKSGKLINALANHKSVLQLLEEMCSFDAANPMFKNQDPQTSSQFLRLCLELVAYLGDTYPADAKKNPTKFKLLQDRLIQKNVEVQFPAQSDLMQPLKKPNNTTKSMVDPKLEPPEQLEKKSNPIQASAVQFSNQNQNQNQQRDNVMLKLNNLRKQVQEDIDMIFDTLREGEGEMEYVNDVLETYSKSFKVCSETFKKQILEAQSYDDTLSDIESRQLMEMQDFTAKFPQLYSQYLAAGSTNSAYEKLKQRALQMIQRIGQGGGTPNPGFDDQPQKNEQALKREAAERQKEEERRREDDARKKQQQDQDRKKREQEEQRKQDQQRQDQQRQDQQRQDQQRQDQQRQDQQRQDQQRQDQQRQDQQRQDQQRQDQQKQDQQRQEQQRQEQQRLAQQQRQDLLKQSKQQFEDDHDNQFQGRPTGSFHPSSTILQKDQLLQSHAPPSQGQQKVQFVQEFDSMSSISQVPARAAMKLPLKNHRGRQVQFDDSPFAMLFQYNLNDQQLRKWKCCNFRGEGILYEDDAIQVGVSCALHFNLVNQKSYLTIGMFVGNKLPTSLNNLSIVYEGDNQKLILWIKPEKVDPVVPTKMQAKQELILAFRDPTYICPNLILDAQGGHQSFHQELFLPATLLRFVDFKDIDAGIFRPKWRAKKSQIIKSEMFKLNPQVVRSVTSFKKFFPRLCELIPYSRFVDQRIDYHAQDIKYLNYKLGGVFELLEANTEYMIKVIIYPNLMSCVQMIPHYHNSRISEQLINTIVFIIGSME